MPGNVLFRVKRGKIGLNKETGCEEPPDEVIGLFRNGFGRILFIKFGFGLYSFAFVSL